MTKILHTADWQIGRSYGTFDLEDAVSLSEARFAAVERLAALATSEGVGAVVVAGDVFDAQTVSARSIRRLFHALQGYAGPWVMISGNHDAALAEGVWSHVARLGVQPPNVHLVLEPKVLELPERRIALLCAPLTQRHTYGDLTEWFDAAETPVGWLRVGVAHGAVQGLLPEDLDSTNPIAPDRAHRARLDYLALGDWHGTKRIDDRTWYSGTPEPDRFRSNEAGQALLVQLDQPGATPTARAIRTARHRWRQLLQSIDVASDLDALVDELSGVEADDVLDVRVTGQVDLSGHVRLQSALAAAEGRARCLRSDLCALQLAPTAADIASLHADGYLGEVIAELRDTTGDDARRAQDALDYAEMTKRRLVPKGLDVLRSELDAAQARHADSLAALAQLPPPPGDPTLPLADADRLYEACRDEVEAISQRLQDARQVLARAASLHDAARRERGALKAALDEPRLQSELAAKRLDLVEAGNRVAALESTLADLDARIASARPDILAQDVERLKRSADEAERVHQKRDRELFGLEAALAADGAQGLEEELAQRQSEHAQAQRRLAQLRGRAEALDFLLQKLELRRQALTRRLQAPLQKHLDRYLQLLFPAGTLQVEEDLVPGALTRPGPAGHEASEFETLSFGAREQMGVISRLAYADLLKEAGRPTLIILDDVLVHSDASRLAQMKRVLFDAAQRHQVLLFTCHPESWRDMGVPLRALPTER